MPICHNDLQTGSKFAHTSRGKISIKFDDNVHVQKLFTQHDAQKQFTQRGHSSDGLAIVSKIT